MNRFAVEMRPDIEREAGSGRRRSAAVSASRNLDAEDRPRICAPPSVGGPRAAYQARGKRFALMARRLPSARSTQSAAGGQSWR
jgi:hypothetical protein